MNKVKFKSQDEPDFIFSHLNLFPIILFYEEYFMFLKKILKIFQFAWFCFLWLYPLTSRKLMLFPSYLSL